MPVSLAIPEFYLRRGDKLHARITWTSSANPGPSATAQMTGNDSSGVSWISINGGIAFLNVIQGDGASLRLETWDTDNNGDMRPSAIDIFTLPIDIAQPFPVTLANLKIDSPHRLWTYVLSSIPGNPNGFNLDTMRYAAPPAPPTNARVSI